MSPLDDLVDQWVRQLARTEPALAPHLDEIADHVRTDAETRIEAGADVTTAFAAAVGAFGVPRAVADEYRRTARRHEKKFAAWYLAVTLGVTLLVVTAIVIVDKTYYPIDPAWAAFAWVLFLPHLCLPVFAIIRSRASAAAGSNDR